MQTRTEALQFVPSDEENGETEETLDDSRIECSENELTCTHSATTKNTNTDVNYEFVSEPSPSSSHTNREESQSTTAPNDQMNFSHVAGYKTLKNSRKSANQCDEEDKISVGDYSMISGDDFPESESRASDGFRQFDEEHEYRNYENRHEGGQNYYRHHGEANGSDYVSGYYADEEHQYPNYENVYEGEQNYHYRHRGEANGSEHDGGYHEDEAYHISENRHEDGENDDFVDHYYGNVDEDDCTDNSEVLDYNPRIGSKIYIDPSAPEGK